MNWGRQYFWRILICSKYRTLRVHTDHGYMFGLCRGLCKGNIMPNVSRVFMEWERTLPDLLLWTVVCAKEGQMTTRSLGMQTKKTKKNPFVLLFLLQNEESKNLYIEATIAKILTMMRTSRTRYAWRWEGLITKWRPNAERAGGQDVNQAC